MPGLIRIGDGFCSIGQHRVEVIRKTCRLGGSESSIRQSKRQSVVPVIRNVGLIQLRHRHVVAVIVAVLDQVELIHLAAVYRGDGIVTAAGVKHKILGGADVEGKRPG